MRSWVRSVVSSRDFARLPLDDDDVRIVVLVCVMDARVRDLITRYSFPPSVVDLLFKNLSWAMCHHQK